MKIGLIGWRNFTGIGSQNYDLWLAGLASTWLAPRYPRGEVPEYPVTGDVRVCDLAVPGPTARRFAREVDAALFIERPFVGENVLRALRDAGKPVVCVANWEWFPPLSASWLGLTSAVYCPNAHCFDYISGLVKSAAVSPPWRLVSGHWGVDPGYWPFVERVTASRFLFPAGNQGVDQRKGLDIVLRAAARDLRTRWVVLSQKPVPFSVSENVSVRVVNHTDRRDVYRDGDVLVLPSRWEGCGLSFYEGQACGLPVVTVDAEPMRSIGLPFLFQSARLRSANLAGNPFRYAEPCPASLAEVCGKLRGTKIGRRSAAAREWVEQHATLASVCDSLRSLVASLR